MKITEVIQKGPEVFDEGPVDTAVPPSGGPTDAPVGSPGWLSVLKQKLKKKRGGANPHVDKLKKYPNTPPPGVKSPGSDKMSQTAHMRQKKTFAKNVQPGGPTPMSTLGPSHSDKSTGKFSGSPRATDFKKTSIPKDLEKAEPYYVRKKKLNRMDKPLDLKTSIWRNA